MAALIQKLRKLWETFPRKSLFKKVDQRQLQFETDVHRLFLATSYNRLGKNACEKDAEEICDLANRTLFDDQQKRVQENIHVQIQNICGAMDDILAVEAQKEKPKHENLPVNQNTRRSGLSFALGGNRAYPDTTAIAETSSIKGLELSNALKERIGYTLELKASQIRHGEAGQGLYLSGRVGIGAVVSFYPGVIYSPSNYRCIPGYPRVDDGNPYLISRYDGIVIDAQPWGTGGKGRELWNGTTEKKTRRVSVNSQGKKVDLLWQVLSKPPQENGWQRQGAVLERRNPLALGHFANHPEKGVEPNVMICPYNYPLSEAAMRPYIPNLLFGGEEEVIMERYGSFWLRPLSSNNVDSVPPPPAIRTLVLVATRPICDQEILLNYRLSNPKRRPPWYYPVDDEEDRRRWG